MTKDNLSKKALIIINLIFGQVFVCMTITGYIFLESANSPYIKQFNKESFSLFIFLVSFILSIVTVFVFSEIIKMTRSETEAKLAEQRLKDSQELIQVLRSNQHDFINHLQVIYSAAQLGKLEEANEYFHGIVKQVKELGAVSRIVYPEIAALIHSKIAKAEELSAKVSVSINTDLSNLHIPSIELTRILGNLLDNAIFALKEVAVEDRELIIKIVEYNQEFSFTIYNRCPIIPVSIQERIFEPGYTTKGDDGSGLGLYNVKALVEKNHGSVRVVSNVNDGTSFIIDIKNVI